MGDCQQLNGNISLTNNCKISYVSQTAWIVNATLKDNILFGNEFNEERYQKVLFACSLEADLLLLEFGDLTEIGEKGMQ